MQLECRNLLGLQFDEQIVSSFEHREEELFEVVWPLWRAYAEHPYLVVRDPARTCKKHVDRQLQDVTSDVESELISLFAKSR
jgi:hypothetical protein